MSVVTENNKNHLLNYEGVESLLVKINDRFARTDRYATQDTLGMIKAEVNTDVNSENINMPDTTGDNYPVQITTEGNAFVNIPTSDDNPDSTYLKLTGGILTGDLTAPTFIGNLTGNVTGNVSGSSGSCTGNAASATKLSSTTVAFTPAETTLTPDEVYALVGGTTIKRGTWSYTGNGHISNDTTGVGTIDLAGVTVIQADAGSSNQYTQLYLTSSTGSAEGYKPNEIFMYNKNSGYSPSWTRVLTNRNYTDYCLPLTGGTLTGTINSQNIIPTVNNTYNLGSGDYKWKNIYASNFIENGANINTIYADKSYADYCSSYLHSANRAQFCKPAGVTIEYSTDGGSTWIDYGATDDQKVGFFSGISQDFVLGKKLSTKATSSDMLRITMDATSMGVYTSCKCLLLHISTNGSSNFRVKVEKSMKGSADTFDTFIESQTLTGWSGWNRIPIGYKFGGNIQNYNIAKLRLTFSSDGAGSSYTSGAHAYVLDMEVLGNTYWTIPHTMAKTGHLYTWDAKGNAIFNESVTAKYIYPNNGIVFAGTDTDRNLIRIGGNVNETIDSKSNYGYTLKYLGLGTGVNNALALYADNETADEQILGTKWLNDGTMYSRNILPHDNNTYSLGSSSLKWKNIYAMTFTGALTGNVTGDVNGNVTGNLTGDVNGNASSATNASNIYISTNTGNAYYPMTFVTTTSAGNKKLYIGGSTGTTSSGSGIRYNPNTKTCYCSGGFYEASDERLKNFSNDIEVDLDKLSKLSKKYFTWKDDESNAQHIGVSAQEVQDIYPELVDVIDEDGHLSVSYDKLSVVALAGIDKLNNKVKSLEERLERLEKLIKG